MPSNKAVQEMTWRDNQQDSAPASHTVSQDYYQAEQQQGYNRPHFPATLDGTVFSRTASTPLTSGEGDQPAIEAPNPHIITTIPPASASSQNPSIMGETISSQAAAPIESVPPKDPSPSSQIAPDAQASQPAHISPSNGSSTDPDYSSKSLSELRSLAKGALLSFAPHGIQFEELIKEGIHPEVLKQLYTELGMKIGPSPFLVSDTRSPSNVAVVTSTGPEAKPESEPAPPAPVISPSLERKDRIAQLLAAKAGRPGLARSTSESKASLPATASAQADVHNNPPSSNQGTLSLHISMPQSRPSTNALSSPFTSGIPGLAMMSGDDDGGSAPRPAKRPLDGHDELSDSAFGHKRQNTGLSSKTEGEAMEIDDNSSVDASEGEVIESPLPSKATPQQNAQPSPTATPSINAPSQVKPFAASTMTKLTPAQMAEKAEMLKAKFLKQRARQKALQDGLPDLEAEVSRTEVVLAEQRAQLDQTRQRIASLEADLAKAQQDENDQLSQIRRSEQQLQEGLSGRKKYTEELQTLTNEQSSTGRGVIDTQSTASPVASGGVSADTATITPAIDRQPEAVQEKDPQLAEEGFSDESAGTAETDGSGAIGATPAAERASHQTSNVASDADDGFGANANGLLPDEHVEDIINKPDGSELEQRSSNSLSADADNSDGSASMSDSASEAEDDQQEEGEYEPPEDDPTQPMDIDEGSSDGYEPTDTPMDLSGAQDDLEEGEEVEPEAGEPITSHVDTTTAPANDLSTTNAQSDVERGLDLIEQQDALADSEPTRANDIGANQGRSRNSAPATPSGRWNRGRPNIRPLANARESKSNSFSAYQSPLTSFPAYRHNTLFDESAKDGYRSLTYSNKIDPKVPLCPTELAGEICQDPQCEEQHFRHLGLPGKLLHLDT